MKKILLIFWLTVIALSATSQNCVQCDENSSATGNYASVIGISTLATNNGAFAGGIGSEANGAHSFAFGHTAKTFGHYSFALGGLTTANGSSSFAFGSNCTASGTNSFVIGYGQNPSTLLNNPIGYSLMIGINSDRPTLFIGESGGAGHTGSIGIGDVTEPQAKLHIKADDNEPAVLLIEPHIFTGGESAKLRLGTMDYGISAGYSRLYFNTGGDYIFNSSDAKVGIGTFSPSEKLEIEGNVKITSGNLFIDNNEGGVILKSPDEQCWKVTVNNNGELITTLIDCNLISDNSNNIQTGRDYITIYPNPAKNKIKIESSYNSYQKAKLTDMNGALVIVEQIFIGLNELSIKNLPKGYYILTVSDEENRILVSEKILKN